MRTTKSLTLSTNLSSRAFNELEDERTVSCNSVQFVRINGRKWNPCLCLSSRLLRNGYIELTTVITTLYEWTGDMCCLLFIVMRAFVMLCVACFFHFCRYIFFVFLEVPRNATMKCCASPMRFGRPFPSLTTPNSLSMPSRINHPLALMKSPQPQPLSALPHQSPQQTSAFKHAILFPHLGNRFVGFFQPVCVVISSSLSSFSSAFLFFRSFLLLFSLTPTFHFIINLR